MSKIDFKALVESFLLENKSNFLQNYGSKISGTNDSILTAIYQLVTPGQKNYIPGKAWKNYTKFTPLFSAIVYALGQTGTLKDARQALINQYPNGYTEDQFYDLVDQGISNYASSIKEFDQLSSQERKALSKDVLDIHNAAIVDAASNVLIQNAWPSIQNLTIVDAVTTLIKNRLTGLENLKLHFVVPLNTVDNPMVDGLMKDIFYNLEAYSKGSKKYNANVTEIFKNINIIPEDFVKVGTYTVQLYKQLITDNFAQNQAFNQILTDSLTNDNIYNFAKTGIFTYIENGQANSLNPNDKYTLSFIEKLDIDPGNDLIEQIKSMSSGIRVKDQSWQQKFQSATQTLGALAGLGGVGDIYGSVR